MTFAFTDVEASSRRWERHRAAMERAVRRHDELLRAAVERCDGYVFKALGDAFCVAFARPLDAVDAMLGAQRALAAEDFSEVDGLPVRTAIHTGTADERDGDYFGPAVNRVARLLALAHGGQLLCSESAAAVIGGDLPSDASLRDLGQYELRDLDQSERVYQIVVPDLRSDFPPLRTASSQLHLPAQLTSFVGREHELAEIAALVRSQRIVTLVGSGGVGKTRTALHVATGVARDFADGVRFIELAPLSSGDHVATAAAHAAGVALPAGHDPLDELVRALKAKRMLLIFDNCEHVVGSAAPLVSAIAAACPGVKVLATSRQPLEISGERTYALASLDPTAASALFADRARAVDGNFAMTCDSAATVADICERLDGIPLAIELAASRAAVLSPKQIAEKLDARFRLLAQKGGDRLPRQQTLRALIDWSYELLDQNERVVFGRLASFAGGWTLAAASAVCSDEAIDEWQVLDALSALVTKSLVVAEPGGEERRYRMLYSIHEYGREQLAASGGADTVAAKHAAYFADFARERSQLIDKLEDERWQHALVPELDNIRAALTWAVFGRRDRAGGLRLLAHLEWPELVTTPHEAVRWYDAVGDVSNTDAEPVTRSRVMRQHVRLERLVGRSTAERERLATDAAEAARASGDPDETAHALALLGSVYRDARRFDEAERAFVEAYEGAASLSPLAFNALLRNWAVANLQRGDVEMARRRFTEVARRERPGSAAHAGALINIGELEFAVGNVAAARAAASEARAIYKRLNAAPLGLATCNLAAYAMAVDELGEARELLREAVQIMLDTGARWTLAALEHNALLAGLSGDLERAAALAGFTSAQYAGDDTRQTTERIGYDRLMRLLRERYTESELSERMDAGASLNERQALECAAAIESFTPTAAAADAAEKRA